MVTSAPDSGPQHLSIVGGDAGWDVDGKHISLERVHELDRLRVFSFCRPVQSDAENRIDQDGVAFEIDFADVIPDDHFQVFDDVELFF